MWKHKEQIFLNLAHKVAKKIIRAKWKNKIVQLWFGSNSWKNQ
jgi:hypothetical protein